MKTATILARAIVYGGILTVVIAVVGSVVGYLVAGGPGLVSGLIGAGLTALFMGFTALSIVIAARVTKGEGASTLFFGIVLGAWLLKFVVFLVILILLRNQPFVQPVVMFVSIVTAVVGSLVVDVVAYVRARVPYVGDVALPGDEAQQQS